MKRLLIPAGLLFLGALSMNMEIARDLPSREWPEYLGGPDRNHYSPLDQINTANVSQLKVAWEFHTGDSGQVQCNPIIVGGILYGVTASNQLFALDAATGQEKWRFAEKNPSSLNTNRGVTYWQGDNGRGGIERRILFASGSYLRAVDALTGEVISTFGENGRVSLKTGLGESAKDKFVISNTPGTLFEDLIIMPLRLSEGSDAAPGHVQAFNVRTGKLAWVFRTIPHPGEFGYETWPKETYKNTDVGGANNWAGMAIDRKRGIVYVPTGSAAADFYGANRKGSNLFANSLLALDARTGKRLWHFQAVHHDIWDRDFPAPPNLLTVTQNGKKIDAVAQVTKSGHVFVFDRVTGKPLFPIRETPVMASDVPGEQAWPTQPLPLKPAPFARQSMTEADVNPHSPDRDSLLAVLKTMRMGYYRPLGLDYTLTFPGLDGGAEWGGAAVDIQGVMYVNANNVGWALKLNKTPDSDLLAHLSPGERVYTVNCATCHGPERKGNPGSGFPSLVNLNQRRDRPTVNALVTNGKGMMPGFPTLTADEKSALLAFLFDDEKKEAGAASSGAVRKRQPYHFGGYKKFIDSRGYPATSPPWGTLTAIDLNTGNHLWQKPFGEYPELSAKGVATTGTENYGGPVVTAGGLLFIAATLDGKFRAYNKKTGQVLFETQLPAAGFATPSTYEVNGKQYVVVACGGTKLSTKKGDSYVAFALP